MMFFSKSREMTMCKLKLNIEGRLFLISAIVVCCMPAYIVFLDNNMNRNRFLNGSWPWTTPTMMTWTWMLHSFQPTSLILQLTGAYLFFLILLPYGNRRLLIHVTIGESTKQISLSYDKNKKQINPGDMQVFDVCLNIKKDIILINNILQNLKLSNHCASFTRYQ